MSNFVGQFKDKDGNSLFPINMQVITNSNGTALKFSDGTLICFRVINFTGIAATSQVGQLFYAPQQSLGAYPVPFISTPALTVTSKSVLCVSEVNSSNATNAGNVYMFNATSRPSVSGSIDYIAIGRWK